MEYFVVIRSLEFLLLFFGAALQFKPIVYYCYIFAIKCLGISEPIKSLGAIGSFFAGRIDLVAISQCWVASVPKVACRIPTTNGSTFHPEVPLTYGSLKMQFKSCRVAHHCLYIYFIIFIPIAVCFVFLIWMR